jgi:hypothetical protein
MGSPLGKATIARSAISPKARLPPLIHVHSYLLYQTPVLSVAGNTDPKGLK